MKIAIDISPISKTSTSQHKIRGVGMYINFLVENIKKIDKKNEYDFIEDRNFPTDSDIVHYPYFDPFFATLPSKLPFKTLVTVHDLTPLVFPKQFPVGIKGRIKWILQKKKLQKVNRIVADSNSSKKDIIKIAGISEEKIDVVYLALGNEFKKLTGENIKKEIKDKYKLPESFLLYVGDATWNKNLPVLVEAVKKTSTTLVLVGKVWETPLSAASDNPWNDSFKRTLFEIEGNKQFIKLGFLNNEDLVKIYNTATALIMPSIYEGFGFPVLEAMTCGCPVISSRGGSLPEVGGNAVIYTDYENPIEISLSIEKLVKDNNLWKKLSESGLKRAADLSVEKSIRDLVSVYEKIK